MKGGWTLLGTSHRPGSPLGPGPPTRGLTSFPPAPLERPQLLAGGGGTGPQLGQASTCSGHRIQSQHFPPRPAALALCLYRKSHFQRGANRHGLSDAVGKAGETWALGGASTRGRPSDLPEAGPARLRLQESLDFPERPGSRVGPGGLQAVLPDSEEPALARGSLRPAAPGPACSPGPRAQLASRQQWSGASWEPRQSRPDFKAGQRAQWRLRVHTWLGRCCGLLCPARRPCPSGASGGQAQGGRHTQADPSIVEREVPAGDPGNCARREVQESRGGLALGAGPAHTAAPLPAALSVGVHSPRFSRKGTEGKRLPNSRPCQLSLKLVCRRPGQR